MDEKKMKLEIRNDLLKLSIKLDNIKKLMEEIENDLDVISNKIIEIKE